MTQQTIFNAVAVHLLAQMERATNKNGCAYRVESTGLKCAIGCLFTDAELDAGLAQHAGAVEDLISRGLMPARLVEHEQLLTDLQTVHDGGPPLYWGVRLKNVTDNYDLNPSIIWS